ncbi:hypothetical protein CN878_12200 [Ochrobactrum sp. 695/2009]|nr:hypothetical protein CN881_15290 [Ochrobactrum sp. 721/2009]PJT16204.1 hypothetical protein CN880_07440 [Ochrobactrum sp. 720/2009]PJT26024.1 hypothetical protein CN879_03405 [Ochrobactrum sp. 715/2009]PJT29630.1 hypothetical protein CN878_12200 [Ochrobactrum sp. 695/2009]PJT35545.1 hypothetical protein CN877_05855 [Ochrobactrum sp. 689/2009]
MTVAPNLVASKLLNNLANAGHLTVHLEELSNILCDCSSLSNLMGDTVSAVIKTETSPAFNGQVAIEIVAHQRMHYKIAVTSATRTYKTHLHKVCIPCTKYRNYLDILLYFQIGIAYYFSIGEQSY